MSLCYTYIIWPYMAVVFQQHMRGGFNWCTAYWSNRKSLPGEHYIHFWNYDLDIIARIIFNQLLHASSWSARLLHQFCGVYNYTHAHLVVLTMQNISQLGNLLQIIRELSKCLQSPTCNINPATSLTSYAWGACCGSQISRVRNISQVIVVINSVSWC